MLNSRTYLYQRNGVFYIRLRMKIARRLTASLPSHNRYKLASVSLRTKDRRTAMAHSRHIKSALKAIHADNPNASYEELRKHLKTIVEWELSVSRDDLNDPESYQLYVDQYDDIKSNLREAVATERLTVDQHRYINDVIGVLKACQDRLRGDSSSLLSYLEPETGSLRPSVSLSVLAEPEVPEPKALTLTSLIEQYEQENAQNWKPATLSENRASHSTLIEIFDYLDIQDVGKATRSDMLRVREVLQLLPKNRKQRFKAMSLSDLLNRESKTDCLDVVTINNKYLIKMAAVFKWAVRNDLIAKNLTEGLELKVPQRKASDARDAFSPEQVGQLRTLRRPQVSHTIITSPLWLLLQVRDLTRWPNFRSKTSGPLRLGPCISISTKTIAACRVRVSRTPTVTAVSLWSMALMVLYWLTLCRLWKTVERLRVIMLWYSMASS